jgi:hypothetical protein
LKRQIIRIKFIILENIYIIKLNKNNNEY